jgi:ubiquinone/menaquinone biosynthesis C-methylase UbiE
MIDNATLGKEQSERLEQSRGDRSTRCFYSEKYWRDFIEFYGAKLTAEGFDENHVTTKFETEKKVTWMEKFFPHAKSFLDVACSFGVLVAHLRDKGYNAWGIDGSPFALSNAPVRVKPYLVEGSVTDLGMFKDDEFDLVTAFDILEHLYIEEIYLTVKEMNRVAKTGIFLRMPTAGFAAEPWLADTSYTSLIKEHVSVYPWDFWVRRFVELGKFEWTHTELWTTGASTCCELLLFFGRKNPNV